MLVCLQIVIGAGGALSPSPTLSFLVPQTLGDDADAGDPTSPL